MKIIITVRRFDDTIKSLTSDGVVYISDDGQEIVIPFQTCYENYLKKHPSLLQFPEVKKVGERDIDKQYVEFETEPITRFEFNNRDDWYRLVGTIRRLRWSTFDMS